MSELGARLVAATAAALVMLGAGVAGCSNEPAEPKPVGNDRGESDNDSADSAGADSTHEESTTDPSGRAESSPEQEVHSPGSESSGRETAEDGDAQPVDTETETAARQTVTQFLRAYDTASRSGDTSAMEQLQTDSCKRCSTIASNVRDIYDEGGRAEGGGYINPEPVVHGREDSGRTSVVVDAKYAAYKVYDSAGSVVDSDPEKRENERFWLEQAGDELRVAVWR